MAGAAAAAGAGGFVVDNSVRYNDDDSPRLYRTPTVAGNRMVGSLSLWYKRCNLGSIQQLYNAGAGDDITFNASDQLTFIDSSGVSYITTQVFRDPAAWGHLLFAWDTTDTTAGDRLRIYHNGVEITAFDTETNPDQFDLLEISNTVRQTVGANESDTEELDGYLSQVYLVDGAQLTPTSFGEFDDYNVWKPIEYAGGDTVTSWIDASGETLIGNMTGCGGLAAAWDGNPTKSFNACACGSDIGYAGIDWGSGNTKTITRMITIGSSDYGYSNAGRTIEVNIEGSTDNFSSSVVDLGGGTGSFTDATGTGSFKMVTPTSTTAYRYHRAKVEVTSESGGVHFAQVFFYEEETGYGTNGFLLDFADSSDFGNDTSGNNNDYTSSGLAANDQVSDTPTKNYATFASNSGRYMSSAVDDLTWTDGNLHIAGTTTYNVSDVNFVPLNTGKWYFTWDHDTWYNANNDMGIVNEANRSGLNGTPSYSYDSVSGAVLVGLELSTKYNIQSADFTNIQATIPVTATTSDQTVMAVDIDNLKLWAGFWDESEDDLYWMTNAGGWSDANVDVPATGTDETCAIIGDNFTFYGWCYSTRGGGVGFGSVNGGLLSNITQPSGFNELNTANLATPTILDGTAHFQPTLYTGDGSVRNIDQTGNSTFQPDTVWIKNRSAADGASIFDSNRGATKYWGQSTTAIEVTNANSLTSFDSDGFGLGSGAGGWNDNTENFVAWQWLAGGAGSSNTDGSINTDKTSVNTTTGMSIGLYTGNATVNATVGHGLGVKPDMFIVKNMDSAEQIVMYIGYLGAHYGTYLGATAAPYDLSIYWNDVEPTSTVINLDDFGSVNGSGHELILWAFVSVDGFSKFGSYTGNGDADGTYVYTGFKPAMILIGKTSSTRTLWPMYDSARSPYNEIDDQLAAINSAAETTGSEEVDFLSNGFKIRTADSDVNTSAATYFFAAWAEYPFGGDGVTPATAF